MAADFPLVVQPRKRIPQRVSVTACQCCGSDHHENSRKCRFLALIFTLVVVVDYPSRPVDIVAVVVVVLTVSLSLPSMSSPSLLPLVSLWSFSLLSS